MTLHISTQAWSKLPAHLRESAPVPVVTHDDLPPLEGYIDMEDGRRLEVVLDARGLIHPIRERVRAAG